MKDPKEKILQLGIDLCKHHNLKCTIDGEIFTTVHLDNDGTKPKIMAVLHRINKIMTDLHYIGHISKHDINWLENLHKRYT